MWWVLEKKQVSNINIDVIKDMYDGAITRARTIGGETKLFSLTIGLHQESP